MALNLVPMPTTKRTNGLLDRKIIRHPRSKSPVARRLFPNIKVDGSAPTFGNDLLFIVGLKATPAGLMNNLKQRGCQIKRRVQSG